MDTFIYTVSISLFDSLSTTQQIIIFMLLLTTVQPFRNALMYLAGLSGTYFLCGIAGYQVLDRLMELIARFIPSSAKMSDNLYYQSEILTGLIMIAIGYVYFRKKRHAAPSRTQNIILKKLSTMNGFVALGIGVFISLTCFPFSIPYLLALGKFSSMHMSLLQAAGNIFLYNFGYALPMLIVFAVYLFYRRKVLDVKGALEEKARVLNVHLTTWAFAGIGLFSVIDAGSYYALGHALLKGRFF